ncbi:hypothetical protein AB205_0115270 [Aquarana catesbeiana]|uniref:Uncharacterized protein n=1 Tax=Aquarana catesbeiana TaxID=8400 RepID=A0A2G9RW47_AQUCT|nr:hypothetical protein AB205_0115270 [Aquarana catesbeiana]
MLLLVLILQLVAAVLGFIFSGMVLEKASNVMSKAIIRYREDADLENFIDYIQKKVRFFFNNRKQYQCIDQSSCILSELWIYHSIPMS